MDKPFIVINSGTLKLLDDDELRNVLGHELGHVMSGHALYHTILVLILNVSLGALPFLAGIAILPIQLALLEWFRKSELSSDRAGLLGCQDPTASLRVNLKFAGGGDMSQMDLNAFLMQAKEYEEAGGALDRIFKILGVLGRSHPFNTVRAAELQRWIEEGHYDRVLRGEYTRRGPDAEQRPIDKDIDDARDHYMKERSEEHTSELQSQSNLVCRLLLEKKKNEHAPARASPQYGRDAVETEHRRTLWPHLRLIGVHHACLECARARRMREQHVVEPSVQD